MKNKKVIDGKWIITITLLAFVFSVVFSLLSELIIPNTYIFVSVIVVLLVILLGVLFDMIGVAITVAEEKAFNSMASKNIKRANLALKLIKNKDKVSSFCNDVIGDICGIISGSCGATISAILIIKLKTNSIIPVLIITAIIAALTIGGKAIGKGIAIKKANKIIDNFSKILYPFVNKK